VIGNHLSPLKETSLELFSFMLVVEAIHFNKHRRSQDAVMVHMPVLFLRDLILAWEIKSFQKIFRFKQKWGRNGLGPAKLTALENYTCAFLSNLRI